MHFQEKHLADLAFLQYLTRALRGLHKQLFYRCYDHIKEINFPVDLFSRIQILPYIVDLLSRMVKL